MMDDTKLTELMDQQRWLLNNGLIPDSVKNQLFFYGSVVHPEVEAVEVKIHPENKLVEYTIYISRQLIAKISKYRTLSADKTLFGMWRFRRFLKKEGTLDFHAILSTFVADFCGPKWKTSVNTIDFGVYVDTVIGEESDANGGSGQPDKLSD
jgi:hypothetical protein